MADPRFPPVQNRPQAPPPRPRKTGVLILPVILLLVYGAYVGVMLIAPIYVEQLGDALDDYVNTNIRLGIGVVLLVLFAIIMIIGLVDTGRSGPSPSSGRRPAPGLSSPSGSPPRKFKPVQPSSPPPRTTAPESSGASTPPPERKGPAPQQSPGAAKRTVIPYPLEVEGGIYGETMIQLSPVKVLRLRSLVVEPEYLD